MMIKRLFVTATVLAAILPSQMIMWSYITLGMGLVSVISTFTAQSLGRKQDEDCGGYAWQAICLSVLCGATGGALIPYRPGLLALLGHAPAREPTGARCSPTGPTAPMSRLIVTPRTDPPPVPK